MYKVKQSIHFCYAHRLLDYQGKCAHLHGHNAEVELEISSSQLNAQALVIDFNDIKRIAKEWIDRELDHKTLLRKDDPLAQILKDFGEPVFLTEQNPSAEALAQLIQEECQKKGLNVSKVTFWESPRSCAIFEKE